MSPGVVAMRLRLALLRHQISIEADRLLSDNDYAVEIWALCTHIGEPALVALAERLMSTRVAPAADAPAAASNPGAQGGDTDAGPQGDPSRPRERSYLRGAR
jgi:hypothetical protein